MISVAIIGASTGKPSALTAILSCFAAGFSVPMMVIVQHILADSTGPPDHRPEYQFSVKEEQNKDRLEDGCVYMTPAKKHTVFARGLIQSEHGRNHLTLEGAIQSAARSHNRFIVRTGAGPDSSGGVKAIKGGMGILDAMADKIMEPEFIK